MDRAVSRERSGFDSGISSQSGAAAILAASTSFAGGVGTVAAWGTNLDGELGDGTTLNGLVRGLVAGLSGVTAIAAGYSAAYALRSDGTVWSWGANWLGQLGDGTMTESHVPVQVQGISGVTAIAASIGNAYALRGDGTVWAWGHNAQGALGGGAPISTIPVQVTGLTGVTAIAAGGAGDGDGYALLKDGTVKAWGFNNWGSLGNGTLIGSAVPVTVLGVTGATSIYAGNGAAYAILGDGTVRGWGMNAFGDVGDGDQTTSYVTTPVQVLGLTNVKSMGAGDGCAVAVRTDGSAWAWGQCGLQKSTSAPGDWAPRQLPGLSGVVAASGRTLGGLVLLGDGSVWSWGDDDPEKDALGDGVSNASYGVPVRVSGLTGVKAIGSYSFASYELGGTFGSGPGTAMGPVQTLEHSGGSNPAEVGSGSAVQSGAGQPSAGEPVDLSTGAFWSTTTDLSVSGRAPSLAFVRTYGSDRAAISGRLGYGWRDSYDWRLAIDTSTGATAGQVTILQGNGSQTQFSPNGTGGYVAPGRVLASLTHQADGTWTYVVQSVRRYTFTSAGLLSAIHDVNGYATVLAYDSSGRLSTVTDPAGRRLTLAYDSSNRVVSITDPLPRTVTFSYDTSGNLSSVKDADGRVTSFGYDATHHLTTKKDPMGYVLTNAYDTTGRITSQVSPRSAKTSFSYAATGDGLFTTTVTHPLGAKDTYTFFCGLNMQVLRGLGTALQTANRFSYNGAGTVRSSTDGLGRTSQWTYDGVGNILTATDALGRTTTSTYNALNEPLTVQDPLGETATYTYDAGGNRLTVSRPLKGTSTIATETMKYSDAKHPGDITSIVDALGKTTTLTYDAQGDVLTSTDATARKTTQTYNVVGWMTSTVSAAGNATGGVPAQHTTTYSSFTGFGVPRVVTDPLGMPLHRYTTLTRT